LIQTLHKKISEGWSPFAQEKDSISTSELLNQTSKAISNFGKSNHHQKNLLWMATKLKAYMKKKKQLAKPYTEALTKKVLEEFLEDLCGQSNGYFNSARKQLSALIGIMHKRGLIEQNPVKDIPTRKHAPKRNTIYSPEQQIDLLRLCKVHFPNLYLAMLMEFQLLLRPHKEIRLLVRGMFSPDLGLLTIPEGYTKGRKGRQLPVSPIIISELINRGVDQVNDQDNIFTGKAEPFNPYYFSTQWRRFRKLAEDKGKIKADQTLYSFRHTAALQLYRQKNSIEAVKSAMDHAKIRTTFEYLRSLGVRENNLNLEDLPELMI
jgi:integrase